MNDRAAFDRRVLVDHHAKKAGDTGGEERNQDKTQNRVVELRLSLSAAAIFDEDGERHESPKTACRDFHCPGPSPRSGGEPAASSQIIQVPSRSSGRASSPSSRSSSCRLFPKSSTYRHRRSFPSGRRWSGRSKTKTALRGDS